MEKIKINAYKILRWSEKYAKTDMVYLASGGFWLLLGQGVIMVTGLIIAVAFANLVPKDTYGTYQFIMSIAVIISAFTLSGIGTTIITAVAKGRDGALRTGFKTQIIWSSGIFVAGLLFSAYYYINGNNILALSFLVIGTLSPFIEGFGLAKSYLLGKKYFKESAVYSIFRRLVLLTSIITAISLTDNLVIIVSAYYGSSVISGAILYWTVVIRHKLKHSEENKMINYSKHLSLIKTFANIAGQADKILIFHFLGAVPVAVYTLAILPIKQIESLYSLLYSLTFSKIGGIEFSKLKRILPPKVKSMFRVSVIILILYIIAAPYLFKIFFPSYTESVLISQILALTLLSKPRSLYKQAFTAHRMKKEQYVIGISSNILRVVLFLILLPIFGMWGLVCSLLLTEVYLNILIRYQFKHATLTKR
ncbi:MAG: O-antigen/teichoic acid export membrane protein [Candidatus Paceibacteria bacterium]|jgi:O-antigen/teichoic acid export membrane protein